MFIKYQHIERYGTTEVENIQFGTCYVFPKIDGTNASVWNDGGLIKAGSRTRELTTQEDNAEFYKNILDDDRIRYCLTDRPNWRLFGEWLVPHTLKTYRPEAWRRFYVFDVMVDDEYIHYDDYLPIMDNYGIEAIMPLAIIKNPSYEQLVNLLDTNTYLIKDGEGSGEGLVIKNYSYRNKYGRQIWAKIVRSEFKDKHRTTMGVKATNGEKIIESEIIEKYCSPTLVEKTFAKISNDGGWESKKIPQLLNTVFYDLIKEETWSFLKEHKFPLINFKSLQYLCNQKIKELKPELF